MAGRAIKAGEAFVEMYVETKHLKHGLKESEHSLRAWTQNVGKTVAAVGTGMLASLIPAINKAAKQATSLRAFDQVFRGANQHANQLAETISSRVNRSFASMATSMAPLGKMARGLGMTSEAAADFAQKATAAAGDISSFFNIPFDEALSRMRSGLLGSSEALGQFVPNLSAAAVEAELAAMGYGKNAKAAGELEKTLARLNVIQHALDASGATGDLERNAAQWSNVTKSIADSIKQLVVAIGNPVLPIAEKLAGALLTVTQRAAEFVANSPALVQAFAAVGATALVGGAGLAVFTSKLMFFIAQAAIAAVSAIHLASVLRESGAAAKAASLGFAALNTVTSKLGPVIAMIPAKGLLLKAFLLVIGAPVWATVAAFAALTAAAVAVTTWIAAIHKKTGALTPLFEAFSAAGRRIATVWRDDVVPVFRKFSDLMAGLFQGQATTWGPVLEMLAEALGNGVVLAAEAAAEAISLIAHAIAMVIDGLNQLLGIEPRPRTQAKPEEQAAEEAPKHAVDPELQQFANQVKQDTRTPEEIFQEQLKKLNAAREAGVLTSQDSERYLQKITQERDDALNAEFEQSAAGQQARAIEDFADQLIEATRTPEEQFREQMQKIAAAFQAGAITAEVATRAQTAAQDALRDSQERIAEEARKAAEEARDELLDSITKQSDQRLKVAKAAGNEQWELDALKQRHIQLRDAGFNDEAQNSLINYLGRIVDRSDDLDKEIAKQRDAAQTVTASVREAMFGLGTKSVDEELLEQQQEANRKADQARIILERIHSALTNP